MALICSTTYGGCGYIGEGSEWKDAADITEEYPMEYLMCPQCGEDHAFQLTAENMLSLTNEKNHWQAHRAVFGPLLR